MNDAITTSGERGLVLRSPGDVAASLGLLLGYQPTESLVVVLMTDGQVVVSMRMDLPDDWAQAAEHVLRVAQQARAGSAILVVCTARGTGIDLSHADDVAGLADYLDTGGIQLLDLLLVDADRWWSYGCSTPGCCPVEGTAFTPTGQARTRDDLLAEYQPRQALPAAVLARAAEGLPELPSARAEAALQAARRLTTAIDAGRAINAGRPIDADGAGGGEFAGEDFDLDAARVIVAVQGRCRARPGPRNARTGPQSRGKGGVKM